MAGGSDNYSVNDNKVTYEAAEADEQKTTAKKTHQRSESSSKKSSRKGKGKKKSGTQPHHGLETEEAEQDKRQQHQGWKENPCEVN